MKKILIPLALIFAIHLTATELEVPHVAVTGTATIEVTPDKMIWNLRVEIIEDDVSEVARLHDQQMTELLEYLKGKGIVGSKLQTSEIRLSENKVRRGGDYVKEGYRSSTSVAFETSDISSYRELWIGIADIPNVSINEVLFDVSDRIHYQNESRIRAVKVAKEKAENLAEALGAAVHEPLAIEENAISNNRFPRITTNNLRQVSSDDSNAGASLSLGTISITSQVGVKFRISSN